jgi:pyruvate, water dikinase
VIALSRFYAHIETFLNVRGVSSLIRSCQKCMASLFTNRAIAYRVHKDFDHFDVALSVCVQLMVRSDKACSGVIFTLDTETGFRDVVLVTGSWGLGENVVQGAINPDEYVVFKPTLGDGFKVTTRYVYCGSGGDLCSVCVCVVLCVLYSFACLCV